MYQKIKCPYCSAEYIPSEIFMPEDFLESPHSIIKDDKGLIEHVSLDEPCLTEYYTCDYCDKKFKVDASIVYEAFVEEDFDEDYRIVI